MLRYLCGNVVKNKRDQNIGTCPQRSMDILGMPLIKLQILLSRCGNFDMENLFTRISLKQCCMKVYLNCTLLCGRLVDTPIQSRRVKVCSQPSSREHTYVELVAMLLSFVVYRQQLYCIRFELHHAMNIATPTQSDSVCPSTRINHLLQSECRCVQLKGLAITLVRGNDQYVRSTHK